MLPIRRVAATTDQIYLMRVGLNYKIMKALLRSSHIFLSSGIVAVVLFVKNLKSSKRIDFPNWVNFNDAF